MDLATREQLEQRNKKIINFVLNRIEEKCPGKIDLVGVGGSFCNGDFYEKSDLDLVLISKNNDAKCLDKCFIYGDVAFDIYTHDWSSFEKVANYGDPYVTKLIDLDIIFISENGKKKYEEQQWKLKQSMTDDAVIKESIRKHYEDLTREYSNLGLVKDLNGGYMILSRFIKDIEYIIYLQNKAYVKRGTKRIPEEILGMKLLPENFSKSYPDIVKCRDLNEIKTKCKELLELMKNFLGYEITINENIAQKTKVNKKILEPENLQGTYEEIYSNWKNKMHHAIEIKSSYLSFVTMASCQEFYDEMFDEFEIPHIELLGKYNPDNLQGNYENFNIAHAEWRKLYDALGVEINQIDSIEELEKLYK